MPIHMTEPGVDGLPAVLGALRSWQRPDEVRVPLHPGDIGWFCRFGPEATAAAVRTWSDGARLVAVGLYDDGVLRLATDPEIDSGSAHAIADGGWGRNGALLATRGTFSANGPGVDVVEVRAAEGVRAALRAEGWVDDEPWTPLVRDLAEPVPGPGVRIVVVGPDEVDDRVAVQRAAFDSSTFTADRWRAMAAGPAYGDARCLVAYDGSVPVAAVTVWSAGPGRPGLLEPMGVHREHRGRGLGRGITLAAAAALREMGSSSAVVCTPASNAGGVAAYRSAGFVAGPDVTDLRRR